MTHKNESAAERLERLKKEKEAAKVLNRDTPLVEQLTHESDGEPDFNAIAEKLEERKKTEAKGEKCPRCWMHSLQANAEGLCPRCAAVISEMNLDI